MNEEFRRLGIILGSLCAIAWTSALGFLTITDAVSYRQRFNHNLLAPEQNNIAFDEYAQGPIHSLSQPKEEHLTRKERDQNPHPYPLSYFDMVWKFRWQFAEIPIWSVILFYIPFLLLRLIGWRLYKAEICHKPKRSRRKFSATVGMARNRQLKPPEALSVQAGLRRR